jgi:hypothetical protein
MTEAGNGIRVKEHEKTNGIVIRRKDRYNAPHRVIIPSESVASVLQQIAEFEGKTVVDDEIEDALITLIEADAEVVWR